MNTCASCQWFDPKAETCQEPRNISVVSRLDLGGVYQRHLMPPTTTPEMVCDFHAEHKPSHWRRAVSEEK